MSPFDVAGTADNVLARRRLGPAPRTSRGAGGPCAPGRVRFLGEVPTWSRCSTPPMWSLITSDVEGMPGVAIEAALCGVPVVATAAGALPEMPFVTIAEADPALLARPSATRPLPDAKTSRHFTWPSVVARWEAHLDEVMKRNCRPGRSW